MMVFQMMPTPIWALLLLFFISILHTASSFSSIVVPRNHRIGNNPLLLVTRSAVASDSSISSLSSSSPQQTSENEYSFFDEATIYVRAGSGGQGASTFKEAKKGQDGIPDGGNGGVGGNIVFHVDPSLNTLASFSSSSSRRSSSGGQERLQSFRAQGGKDGGRMYDNGRNGEDCVVRVPPGTVVSIIERDDEENEENADDEVGTLTLEEPTLIVAKGGKGGEGTASLKGKKKGATRKGPQGGERHKIRLTLKLIADVALCGVPNAGKSTFLAAVTKAEPKIADYPFTTVVPNLGVWIPNNSGENNNRATKSSEEDKAAVAGSSGVVLCDVPGLIEGAADGVGLGHAFLRHVERCRVILHLIDATGDDPVGDFRMVNDEIQRYGTGSLAKKPQVVVVNKIDAWREEDGADDENVFFEQRKAELSDKLRDAMGHTRLLWVSAKEKENVEELMQRMAAYVTKIKAEDSD